MSVATLVMFNDSLTISTKESAKITSPLHSTLKKTTEGQRAEESQSCHHLDLRKKIIQKKETVMNAITITMSSHDTSHANIMHLHKHVKIFCLHMLKFN